MQPSDELIEKFRQIFMSEYGEWMAKDEAYDNFTCLVELLRIISKPINEHKIDENKKFDSTRGCGQLSIFE
jgi:hypothetical protein